MELKYVRHSRIGFILWVSDGGLYHVSVGNLLREEVGGEIVSAGFARLTGERVKCYGMSESLNIASKPEDSSALAAQLGMRDAVRTGQSPRLLHSND